jgi:acyl-CoA reductase-like NAD-dependent aldehyde dehydrogenase
MSTRRVIVEKAIAKEFTEKFVKRVSTLKVGNPKEPDTIIGPLINQQQFNLVKKSVDDALRDLCVSAVNLISKSVGIAHPAARRATKNRPIPESSHLSLQIPR